jgi:choline dehydrogenase
LAHTEPLRSTLGAEVFPGLSVTPNDAALIQWLKSNGALHAHWHGSAKMGGRSDPMAVVDRHLKVYGVQKLRIVDTSVFPNTVSAFMQAAAYAVAEKAADMIIEDME